jgi:Fanconi anemia group D2 protein
MKPRAAVQIEAVEKHLIKIQKSVNVVVSLVNLCRTHDKVGKQKRGVPLSIFRF